MQSQSIYLYLIIYKLKQWSYVKLVSILTTRIHGVMVTTFASYFEGCGFKSWPGQAFFYFFLSKWDKRWRNMWQWKPGRNRIVELVIIDFSITIKTLSAWLTWNWDRLHIYHYSLSNNDISNKRKNLKQVAHWL